MTCNQPQLLSRLVVRCPSEAIWAGVSFCSSFEVYKGTMISVSPEMHAEGPFRRVRSMASAYLFSGLSPNFLGAY